jgi:hypothetical protein
MQSNKEEVGGEKVFCKLERSEVGMLGALGQKSKGKLHSSADREGTHRSLLFHFGTATARSGSTVPCRASSHHPHAVGSEASHAIFSDVPPVVRLVCSIMLFILAGVLLQSSKEEVLLVSSSIIIRS